MITTTHTPEVSAVTVTDTHPTSHSQTDTDTCPNTSTTAIPTTNSSSFSLPAFTENPGPLATLDSTATPLDAFCIIFGSDTFDLLAEQTNLYAKQTPPGPTYKWYETTANEMKLFLGMILIMGVHRLPQLKDYWSANPLLGVKGITSGMPWRRFRVLLTTLHLADNSLAIPRGQPGFDKLYTALRITVGHRTFVRK